VHWLVETNVSERRTDSIFRAEVLTGSQRDYIVWQEGILKERANQDGLRPKRTLS
jgi:hypothetical protein